MSADGSNPTSLIQQPGGEPSWGRTAGPIPTFPRPPTPVDVLTPPTPNAETRITLEVIKTLPDESIVLADGETRIRLSFYGGYGVPDVIFGESYIFNDIHRINYLAIRGTVSFYRNGYFFQLENKGCNTEDRFTDVRETWVTDCSIQILSERASPPEVKIFPFSQELTANASVNEVINIEPFVRVIIPKLSLWRFSDRECCNARVGSATSFDLDQMWDIRFITAFGIETIRYSPKEVGEKQAKELQIGPLQVKSTITGYECRVIYKSEALETEQCDDITLNLSIAGVDDKPHPIQIQSYSE